MRKSVLPFFISIVILLLTPAKNHAQELNSGIPDFKNKPALMQPLLSEQGVTLSYKFTECHDVANGDHQELLILGIENKLSVPLQVEFDKVPWYNGKCYNCETTREGLHIVLTLPAHQALEGSCEDKKLTVFSKMLNMYHVSALSGFSIKNLKVTPIQ